MTSPADKARYYRTMMAVAIETGRPVTARRYRLIAAHQEWLAAREALGLVNGRRRLQGVAMGKINTSAATMRRAYRSVKRVE